MELVLLIASFASEQVNLNKSNLNKQNPNGLPGTGKIDPAVFIKKAEAKDAPPLPILGQPNPAKSKTDSGQEKKAEVKTSPEQIPRIEYPGVKPPDAKDKPTDQKKLPEIPDQNKLPDQQKLPDIQKQPEVQKQPEQKQDERLRITENEAITLAAMDLHKLPYEEQERTRYIWVTDANRKSFQATVLALNYISRANVIVRPVALGKDKLLILRVSLPRLAPRYEDYKEFRQVWEELQFDPRFSLLITKGTLKFAIGEIKDKTIKGPKQIPAPMDNDKDAPKTITKLVDGPITADTFKDIDIIRTPSEHLDLGTMEDLYECTKSQAPMVTHSYFITRALSAIEDKGIYKVIYGGLYYKFSGIRKGFKKGTDEDNFLEQVGIGNVDKGITAQKLFDDFRAAAARVAIFRSGVTGKPRRIDVFRTLNGRIDGSTSIVSFSHDLKTQDIDIDTHPIMNLLDFKDAAREVIYEKQNGLHGFVLFNGDGVLQTEVPPDIAADTLIPAPHGTRLEPAIGCIRCHASDGGWKVANNDVRTLLGGVFDAFGDLTVETQSDAVDKLAGLYAGDLELKAFPRARDDYASNVLRATGPWDDSKDQTDIVKLSAARLADIYKEYRYDTIHAVDVLRDFGIVCDKKEAPKLLRNLLPIPKIVIAGIIPEDPRIAALLRGISINRAEYDLVYSFVATRSKENRAAYKSSDN